MGFIKDLAEIVEDTASTLLNVPNRILGKPSYSNNKCFYCGEDPTHADRTQQGDWIYTCHKCYKDKIEMDTKK